MPNISVEMVPRNRNSSVIGPVLQGQVSEWTLRVSNQGTAAAENITLKTNVPWINIIHDDEDMIGNNQSNSNCVGPSGTLMHLIHRANAHSHENILKPGETVNVPVQLRTSGGGMQDFYMLFRYQLDKKELPPSSNTKVRWLRNMVSVAVYPSLTVTASLVPSYKQHNEHILSIEVS